MNKMKYSVAALINGVLSLILGCIPMLYYAMTPVSGAKRRIDPTYDRMVSEMNAAVDRLKVLVVAGVILIGLSIVFKIIKPAETKLGSKLLLFVPLAFILLYAIFNYASVFQF